MKNKRIITWVISAFVYLGIVIGGYYIYVALKDDSGVAHGDHMDDKKAEDGHVDGHQDEEEEHDHQEGDDHTDDAHGGHTGESDVNPIIEYDGHIMMIQFEDKQGNPVTELEINHEKLVHLIVVSDDLEDYYHFHPVEIEPGKFQLDYALPDGDYRIFADIKPVGYGYHAEPIQILVGEKKKHTHGKLTPDTNFTKSQDGITVTMDPEKFIIGTPITLNFIITGAEPEKYLGALGHVVILDEHVEEFIHVHPASYTETKFETQFDEPGHYKIWGEFQFNGVVYIYPFVIEVK